MVSTGTAVWCHQVRSQRPHCDPLAREGGARSPLGGAWGWFSRGHLGALGVPPGPSLTSGVSQSPLLRRPGMPARKRPLRSPSLTINLMVCQVHHSSMALSTTSRWVFKHLQGWCFHHLPVQPVPMLDQPVSEDIFPNIQSKPPLAYLEAISSCPIACYLGEETKPTPTGLQPPFR